MLHRLLPTITEEHLKVVKVGTRAGGVRVMAVKAMGAGSLRMAPLVTGAACLSRVTKTTMSPYVLKVGMCRAGVSSEWWLTGSGNLPGASSVAEHSGHVVKQHNWNQGHHPWPLWFMKRVHEIDQSNCMFVDVDVRSVSTFQQAASAGAQEEPFADNCDVTIPVLVNSKALAQGDELRVYWSPRHVARGERKSQITWTSQARVKLGKQQQRNK